MAKAIANTDDKSKVADYILNNTFITPNSPYIIFKEDHAVQDIPVEIQVMKNGMLVPWVK